MKKSGRNSNSAAVREREPAPPSRGRCDTCGSGFPRVCGCLHLGAHGVGGNETCCPDPFHSNGAD